MEEASNRILWFMVEQSQKARHLSGFVFKKYDQCNITKSKIMIFFQEVTLGNPTQIQKLELCLTNKIK